jgi:hypothetical protein
VSSLAADSANPASRRFVHSMSVRLSSLITGDYMTGFHRGHRRAAQAFYFAGISKPVGCPVLRVFCEGRELGMPATRGFDRVSTAKSNSTRIIAAHPCKKRKDGAPLVGMMHAKFVKGGATRQ